MVLQKGNIKLRPYTMQDAPALAIIANNPQIADNMRNLFPHPYFLKDAEIFIQKNLNNEIKGVYAIIYKGKLVGSIGLHPQTDVYIKTAELGYYLNQKYWNKGIITKSIEIIIKYGFESLHLTRIFAGVFENNKASMKVLEKNGFILECIKRKAIFKNNQILDEYNYAKIND